MTTFELYICSKSNNPETDCDEILASYLLDDIPVNYNPDTDGESLPFLKKYLSQDQATRIRKHLFQPGWVPDPNDADDKYIMVEARHTEKFTVSGLSNALDEVNMNHNKKILQKLLQDARRNYYNETGEFITPELAQDICDFFNEKDGLNLTTK